MQNLMEELDGAPERETNSRSRSYRQAAALIVTLVLLLVTALAASWAGIDIGLNGGKAGRHHAAQPAAAPPLQVDVRYLLDEAQREGPWGEPSTTTREAAPIAQR